MTIKERKHFSAIYRVVAVALKRSNLEETQNPSSRVATGPWVCTRFLLSFYSYYFLFALASFFIFEGGGEGGRAPLQRNALMTFFILAVYERVTKLILKNLLELQNLPQTERVGKAIKKSFVPAKRSRAQKVGVSNGPLKFSSARKICPLLDLLAKLKRVLACSCSQKIRNCSHARILVKVRSIARSCSQILLCMFLVQK